MYKIKETFNIDEATYSYEDFKAVSYCQTAGNDTSFPNNTVTAMDGKTFNQLVIDGIIDVSELSCQNALSWGVYYIFRKTLSGKYMPLHVSMRAKTIENLKKVSRKFGEASINYEVFGEYGD